MLTSPRAAMAVCAAATSAALTIALPAPASAAPDATGATEPALWFTRDAANGSRWPSPQASLWRSALDGSDEDLLAERTPGALPSPDGTHIAWVDGTYAPYQNEIGGVPGVFVADADGGNRRLLARRSKEETFLAVQRWSPSSDALLVQVDKDTTLVPLAPGAPLSTIAADASPGVASPDGTAYVYSETVKEGASYRTELRYARTDGTGQVVLQREQTFTPTAWSPDGTALFGTVEARGRSHTQENDVARLPLTAGAAPVVLRVTPDTNESDVHVAPRPARTNLGVSDVHVTPAGPAQTLTWQLAAGTTRVEVYRARGAAPRVRGSLVYSGTATTFTDSAPQGATWTWTVVGFDAAGARDAVRTRADAIALPQALAPLSAGMTFARPSFPVVATQDPATVRYDVAWATRSSNGTSGGWHTWAADDAFARFGEGGQPLALTPGATYLTRVRALDRFGNATPWSAVRATTVPLDQGVARFSSGWQRVAFRNRWGRSALLTKAPGRTATLRTPATRLEVIGERCPTCGRIAVTLDGRRVAVVSTRASAHQLRQVLWTSRPLVRGRTHTLVVTTLPSPGASAVILDAFTVVR